MPQHTGDGTHAGFPVTRASAILHLREADSDVRRAAFDSIVAAYWRPAYAHLRLRRRETAEDAADLVQGFFGKAFEKAWFEAFDPRKAKFRTFFRTCLEGYAANERKAAGRLKRGGGVRTLPLEFEDEEGEMRSVDLESPRDVDAVCRGAFARGLFGVALDRLRRESVEQGRDVAFRLLERYDVDPSPDRPPTYADLAAEFGIKTTDVVNKLALMRRELRRHVLAALREVTATKREYHDEARIVLGLDVK
jgi:DNA-directed RNA polymerase specialized sigma24 family protein